MRSTRKRWRVASSAKAAGSPLNAPATRSWSVGSDTLRANRLIARMPRIPDRKYDGSSPWLHKKCPIWGYIQFHRAPRLADPTPRLEDARDRRVPGLREYP